LEIPEEIVAKAAGIIHVYANYALSIAREIVIDKNFKVFLQVSSHFYLSTKELAMLLLIARGWNLYL